MQFIMTNIDPKFKAILFDLDGTLLDSLNDLAECANKAISSKGFPTHSPDKYTEYVGDGVKKLMIRACPENTETSVIEDCINTMRELYAENWNKHSTLYEGIAELLDQLTQHNVSLNILSNKPDHFCQKIAKHFFSNWKFNVVRGAFEDIPLKPDPTSAINIVKNSPFPTDQWLYLGDTDTDMKTATGANIKAIGVQWGFRSKEELLENGASLVLNSPLDLLDLF